MPPAFAAVIPMPLAATAAQGSFTLSPATRILVRSAAPEAMRVAESLASHLRPATGYRLPVSRATGAADVPGSIVLVLATSGRPRGDEGYRLQVSPDRVTVTAGRAAGLFWAVQTLRQLLPAAIELTSPQPGPWRTRAGTIEDRRPLRVARRDARRRAALLQRRRGQALHRPDRAVQAEPPASAPRRRPGLADRRSTRGRGSRRYGGSTEVGGGPGGYYTQAQYAEIVAYAADRLHHRRARDRHARPHERRPGLVRGAELRRRRAGRCTPGIESASARSASARTSRTRSSTTSCASSRRMTPGPYIHIGGDEAHGDAARATTCSSSSGCRRIVASHGKRMIGWEEIARRELHRIAVAQHWDDPGRRARRGRPRRGEGDHVARPTKAYLDMKYDARHAARPDVGRVHRRRGRLRVGPGDAGLGVAERTILGVEAPLWRETTGHRRHRVHGLPAPAGHRRDRLVARGGAQLAGVPAPAGAQGPRLGRSGSGTTAPRGSAGAERPRPTAAARHGADAGVQPAPGRRRSRSRATAHGRRARQRGALRAYRPRSLQKKYGEASSGSHQGSTLTFHRRRSASRRSSSSPSSVGPRRGSRTSVTRVPFE